MALLLVGGDSFHAFWSLPDVDVYEKLEEPGGGLEEPGEQGTSLLHPCWRLRCPTRRLSPWKQQTPMAAIGAEAAAVGGVNQSSRVGLFGTVNHSFFLFFFTLKMEQPGCG